MLQTRVLLAIALCLPGCRMHSAYGPLAGDGPRGTREAGRAGEAPSTFSIVAHDPETGDLGVAVQSKFFGVGAVVPWVEAGVGAIATQSYANTTYGPRGLALLREGLPPEETLKRLTEPDSERDFRQVGIVDAKGRSASFTGARCVPWAGSRMGDGFTAQGNILVSQATVDAMAAAFTRSKGELAERLLLAMEAGQRAGGDARGRQSAAIVVARKNAGYGGFNDRLIDLRVDEHTSPIAELRRLLWLSLGRDALSRARKLADLGNADEASSLLREAMRRDPDWDAARFELARLLFAAGKTEEGRQELASAVSMAPGYDHYHYVAAQVLAQAGLLDESLKEVERAIVINAEYAHVFRREVESPTSAFRPLRERIKILLRS